MDLKAFRDLKTLHNEGVLSEAEYTAAKLKLLDVTAQQVVEGGAVVAAARGVAASPVVAPAPLENEASPVVTPHEGEASAPAPLEDEAPSDDERAAIDLLFDAIERGDEKAVVPLRARPSGAGLFALGELRRRTAAGRRVPHRRVERGDPHFGVRRGCYSFCYCYLRYTSFPAS